MMMVTRKLCGFLSWCRAPIKLCVYCYSCNNLSISLRHTSPEEIGIVHQKTDMNNIHHNLIIFLIQEYIDLVCLTIKMAKFDLRFCMNKEAAEKSILKERCDTETFRKKLKLSLVLVVYNFLHVRGIPRISYLQAGNRKCRC